VTRVFDLQVVGPLTRGAAIGARGGELSRRETGGQTTGLTDPHEPKIYATSCCKDSRQKIQSHRFVMIAGNPSLTHKYIHTVTQSRFL